MRYISVVEAAQKWGVSERSVRNYCAQGRVPEAFLTGKTWNIPEDAEKPARTNRPSEIPSDLLERLREEKAARLPGGIYHKVQIELTYNSNHIEGSRLSHDQTRFIFETHTIGLHPNDSINVDDIVETVNHFQCIDMVIDEARRPLSEAFIKRLHRVLKTGTSDGRRPWFAVGDYKKIPNEVGGKPVTAPKDVADAIKTLLIDYHAAKTKTFDDLLDFHWRFESIHPFQDGNGRVGRLILFKECLKHGVVPFIIDKRLKQFYYRGLSEWTKQPGYLRDTCLTAQDRFKEWLDYFEVPHK